MHEPTLKRARHSKISSEESRLLTLAHRRPDPTKASAPPPDQSTHSPNHNLRGRDSPSSATNAVADVGGLWCADHPNDLQLDALCDHLKLPTPTTDEHRDQ